MAAPLKATFFAFRRRERGGVLLRATLVHVVLCVALFVAFGAFYALYAGQASDASAGAPAPPPLLGLLLLIFLYCVVTASYEAACLRWMIRGETGGFTGFSLGGDTWRVYSGYWIWFLIGFGTYVPLMLVVGMIGSVAAPTQDPIVRLIPLYGGWLLWALLIFPIALRFAPGNAASVAQRKFSYFASWRASQGQFWALFGSFITLWIIWLFVFVALMFALAFAVFSSFGDNSANATLVNLVMSGGMLLSLFAANFVLAFLCAGVNARAAAAAIAEGRLDGASEDVAEVFA